MLIDKRNEFADGQALSASGALTNVIDLGSARQVGAGRPLWAIVTLDAAADDANGDETYKIGLETDDNDSFSSATEIASVAITRGAAAGSKFVIAVPPQNVERYLRLYATLGGTTPSVTVTGWLTDQEPTSWSAYPDAI